MSDKQLRLQVVFAALDKLTAPLKKINGESTALGKALQATNDRLKALNAQQKDVGRFYELHVGLQKSSRELKAAHDKMHELTRKMREAGGPTRDLTQQFNAAKKAAMGLTRESEQQRLSMQTLRDRLYGAGIGTDRLSKHQRSLRGDIAVANVQLAEQQKRLAAIAGHQQKVAGARQHADKLRTTAGNVAATGIGATVAGAAVGAPLVTGLKEAKHYQTEKGRITALGLGPKVSADAENYARNMKTYGTSHAENLELVRDSMSVFGDLPHAQMVAPMLAKMKFANKAFYGEEAGGENERKFMDMLKVIEVRGGTASAEKFNEQANMVQKVISATGGRVGPTEWLNLIKTGGIAAKGMDERSFYYELEPLVQELGGFGVGNGLMSSYNNLYQGRTSKRAAMNLDKLGLIGDHTKVKHDKVGQTAQLDPGALLGSDLFKKSQFEWMEKVLLPQLAKNGITGKDKILDTIGSLFTNRKAGDLMANMYLQRAQIHKNRTLNEGAYNVDQLEPLAREQAAGKEMAAHAKLADLQLTMGEKILPLYSSAIETVTKALEGLNGFMERNPATAKAMIVGFGILAAILVVLGPLMLGLAALIGPYAMLHVLFAKMGVAGGVLTPILRGMGSGFMAVGKAIWWLGRALLTNPIVLLITLIAVLAFLIYKNWEPLKAFFSDLWDGITDRFSHAWETIKTFAGGLWADVKAAFDGGIGGVSALIMNWSPLGLFYKAFAGVMSWFGVEMPSTFTEFGANIIQGLVNGISSGFSFLKDKIKQLGAMVGMTFAKEQEIHSPSRVFSRFGGFITEGLALGIENGQDAPINQVGGLAKRLTQLGAGIAIGATAMPALSFDTRPPIAPRAAGAGMVIQGDTIQIIVQTQPGMDDQAIARAVMLAMEERDRQKAARTRSSLSDNHF
ncbi:phage tail tape measure protein [Collimonas humicola]|uniref:phage tail tape measure protein n=1 Tax=Collimonas humicola TaxID=2825886 RepID=UPI001B8B3F9A|nr:phage tail protein [Collimonas humicola]